MRAKYLSGLLILLCVLAACGSNASQSTASTSSSSAAQAQAPATTCRSSISVATPSPNPVVESTTHKMVMGPHMLMSANRPATALDVARISAIVANAHVCFDKYKDYHVALNDGYQIFSPDETQDVYHFASTANFQDAQSTFDLTHPSALLYDKVGSGWKFVGVMYSAPGNATLDELNAHIPVSVLPWHLHVDICLPAGDTGRTLFGPGSLFGLSGTITTKAQCNQVGGAFYPQLFGWMVHIPLFGYAG